MAETRLSVHVYYRQYQKVQFFQKLCLKVLRSSVDQHIYSEFQTEGPLMPNAFTDSVSAIRGTVSNNLSHDCTVHAGK